MPAWMYGGAKGQLMRLIKAAAVQALTGLTSDQLREWTSRRHLIVPDEKPSGPGSRALYSWQTVLLLRLAVVLREKFHVELTSQKNLFLGLAQKLKNHSFPALYDSVLVIKPGGEFTLYQYREYSGFNGDALVINMNPHLEILSSEFEPSDESHQFHLFPAIAVK